MEGAREYAELFRSGKYGRLYLLCGSHARGKTFEIYVLPKNISENDILNCRGYAFLNEAVEVYGVTSGQRGWTETYGWLKNGPWRQDFEKLVEARKKELEELRIKQEKEVKEALEAEKLREKEILESY